MEKTQHTPNEWQIKSDYEPLTIIGNIDGPDDGRMHYTKVCELEDDEEGRANARRIVHCVNSHDELVAALALLLPMAEMLPSSAIPGDFDFCTPLDKARKALARAKGAA